MERCAVDGIEGVVVGRLSDLNFRESEFVMTFVFSIGSLNFLKSLFCCLVLLVSIGVAAKEGRTFDWTSMSEIAPQESRLLLDVHVLPMCDPHDAKTRTPTLLRDHAILTRQSKIVALFPMRALKTAPAWLQKIPKSSGRGAYVIPGLIDTHVHVWDEAELLSYLSFGVTTIRNASGMPFHLKWGQDIAQGKQLGSRLLTTGPILNGQGPNTQINHQIVMSADAARAAVQAQYKRGYRHVKVYSNLSSEAYTAILEQARKLGMSVMGHTPEGVREEGIPFKKPFQIPFSRVLSDGLSSIEHVESVVWHGLADELSIDKMAVLAAQIAKANQNVTPTLVAHHNLLQVAKTKGAYVKRSGTELLNPFISEVEQESYAYWSKQSASERERYEQFYLRATKLLFDAGVRLSTGTDAGIFTNIPGQSLWDELDLLVRAGLTPYQALLCATRNAAEVLGMSDQVGQIKAGYQADFLLLESDPSKSILALKKPVGLVVAGKRYEARDLDNWRGQGAKASYDRTRARVTEGLEIQGQATK